MQIIKIDSLIQNDKPMPVITALGEPAIKLNPLVQTINHVVGAPLPEFSIDGNASSTALSFNNITPTPASNATLQRNEAGESYININQVVYSSSYRLPVNQDACIIVEFKLNSSNNDRIVSIGTTAKLNFVLEQTLNTILVSGTSTTGGVLGTKVNVTSAHNVGINKLAVLLKAGGQSKVVYNGTTFDLDSIQPNAGGSTSLNGSGKEKTSIINTDFYNVAVYEGVTPSVAALVEYTK